jgi:mannose-6-phosphate isomerase-like protein (cupin superfamily)
MRKGALVESQEIERPYGIMRMLAGGTNLPTGKVDLRILEIRPGESTTKHFHRLSESIFYITSGQFKMKVGDVDITETDLGAGDIVVIEPDEIHQLSNVGDQMGFVIETMAPPFSKRDIIYL